MCIKDYPWNPNATHTVIKIRMTSDNGIRYFHSNFRIWSIRRRGKVQRTHIRSHTTAKVLPKNHPPFFHFDHLNFNTLHIDTF